jgi:hypothetical protein
VGLRELPYEKLEPLIRDYLCNEEFEDTAALIDRLRPARRRGYLTSKELEEICRWKSARAIHHIKANTAKQIRAATSAALKTRSELRRLEALTALRGVSIPTASAVLMLLDPKRYGVIDIRVWQLMHKVGAVKKNPRGIGFTFQNWYQFLMIIRYFAGKFGVSARLVERTLFLAHKEYQAGRLYLD